MRSDQHTAEARKRPRLLLADDDPIVRFWLRHQLQGDFDCVADAADADEAIALAESASPDVMILDVNMPGGGALRAMREIADRAPHTAVIILSSDEIHDEVVQLMTCGAVAYLRKGVDASTIAATLVAAIDAKRALADQGGSVARPVRVAIADDDAIARFAVETMIKGAHGLVFVGAAASVEDIVYVAALKGADVVVLDWLMPDGGGAEAARRILARSPDTGIVALTSSSSCAAVAEMRRAGAFRLVRKGGSTEDLARTVRAALDAVAAEPPSV